MPAKTKTVVPAKAPADAPVRVRVLRAGDGKISNGNHVAGFGDEFYEFGDKFEIGGQIALALEDRGLVEIEGQRPKRAPAPKEVEAEPEWQG